MKTKFIFSIAIITVVLLIFSCPRPPDTSTTPGILKWENQIKVAAYDTDDYDGFGNSVAISGDYAISGAYGEDGDGTNRGAGYIYYRTGLNTWDAGIKITASDASDDDRFGGSVAISGDYAITGANMEDGTGTDRGAAYIFHRTGLNTWDAGIKISAFDSADDDHFGGSVAISGDYVIVGAYLEDGAGTDRGAAYIFHKTGLNTWDAGTKISALDAADNDMFGGSVSLSGDYAIAGSSGVGTFRGASYIFHRTGTNTWDGGVKITAYDADDNDYFGISVAISGDYSIVGAMLESGAGLSRGAGYIFHRTGTNTWDTGVKITAFDAANGDWFGGSVAISGDNVIAGASWNDGARGASYLFHRTGTNSWDEGIKITAYDAVDNDFFGKSVSISGDYAIAGAYLEGGAGISRGAAYIFK